MCTIFGKGIYNEVKYMGVCVRLCNQMLTDVNVFGGWELNVVNGSRPRKHMTGSWEIRCCKTVSTLGTLKLAITNATAV
jgi:hypothetical protein